MPDGAVPPQFAPIFQFPVVFDHVNVPAWVEAVRRNNASSELKETRGGVKREFIRGRGDVMRVLYAV